MSFTPKNDVTQLGIDLLPTLPATTRDSRYHSDIRVKATSTIIPMGAHCSSAPSYQSHGWSVFFHPEGKRYAHNRTEEGISVVTEADVNNPGIADRIDACLGEILALAAEKDVEIPDSADVFIELDPHSGACYYWIADHANRAIFWVHEVDTIALGLPNSSSKGNLQYALEENYWIHVEMFPITASQYSSMALNELQIILLHAHADALTSDVPTFPYTAEECERFTNLLRCSRESASNPYVTTFVARLWVIVANHRFFTHFGEDQCRMSAVHSVLEAPVKKQSILLTTISKALFNIPSEHTERLERLWVDDLVYTSAWRKHVSERVEDLRLKMIWLFALMIANILMLPISQFPALNKFSILFCILGECITLVLFQEQRKLDGTGAATGAAYLDTRNTSCGFQPTAIVHSLPKVAFVWASILFTVQGFWLTFADIPATLLIRIFIPILVALGLGCFGIWVALHPREKPFEDATLPEPVSPHMFAVDQKDFSAVEVMV